MNDTFLTIAGPAQAKVSKIKGSRFIADAFPVSEVSSADERIAEIRAREPNATHHCWAYRLGVDGHTFRYDDDGEPGGTAGQPILRRIDGRDLTNVLVVVTRYFGGTKLGIGGLVHAYGDAAAAVLETASIIEEVQRVSVDLTFSYDDTSAVEQVLHRFDAEVSDSRYTDVTNLKVRVRKSAVDDFEEGFNNALGGRGDLSIV
jgi:uncharacterized YigZ family protein